MTKRIVVLISGRGSNLSALLDAGLPVVGVFSDRVAAAGLTLAQHHGIATATLSASEFAHRAAYDEAVAAQIDRWQPDVVVLAGYMRILSDNFVQHYQNRLLNIHPSLLPHYPGLNTHARALADGIKIHGCTVHFVTPQLDSGPVILQGVVPVHADDTPDTLAARVLRAEHRIYPQAIHWFLEGRLHVNADQTVSVTGIDAAQQRLFLMEK